jgi:hypothetical protein
MQNNFLVERSILIRHELLDLRIARAGPGFILWNVRTDTKPVDLSNEFMSAFRGKADMPCCTANVR